MTNTKTTILILVSLISLNLVSCKKDSGSGIVPGGSTKTNLLTQKPWKLVKMEQNGVDYTPLLPACFLDNRTSYGSNGTILNDEGATKCDPSSPQQMNGTWAFTSGETKLTGTMNGVTEDAEILQLDENTLKLYVSYMGYTATDTYTHP